MRHKLGHQSGNIQRVCVVFSVYVVAFGGVSRVGVGELQHQREQRQDTAKAYSFSGFEVDRAVIGASNESLAPE